MRSYRCFSRSIGGNKRREWSGSLGCGAVGDVGGVDDGDAVAAFGDGVFGFRKINSPGAQTRMAYGVCCYR